MKRKEACMGNTVQCNLRKLDFLSFYQQVPVFSRAFKPYFSHVVVDCVLIFQLLLLEL